MEKWKDLKGVDKMSNRDGSSVPIQKCKAVGEPLSWPVKCKGFPEGFAGIQDSEGFRGFRGIQSKLKSKVDFNKNKKVSFDIAEPPIIPSGPVSPTKDPTSVITATNSSLKWTVQQVRDTYFLRFCFCNDFWGQK